MTAKRAALILGCLIAPGQTAAVVCVQNGTGAPQFFAAETNDGTRVARTLPPAETLCSPGTGGGVVSVFESAEAVEGCSRLVADGRTETLLQYASFDRCRWSSHGG